MKKKLLIILLLLLLVGCQKREDKLIMATEAGFAPYEYYSDGKIVGVDIDIAKEIAQYLNKELVVKDVAFDSIITEVKTGKSDIGAAGISYTEERSKQVDFSNNYTTSKQVAIVKRYGIVQNTNEIGNKKIAVQLGSIADTFVTENYPNAKIIRQKKYLAAIQDLKDNKVDLVVMDELPAKAILNENPDLKMLPKPLTIDSYGIIVDKGNKELLNKINEVINRLKKEGKIEEFIIYHENNS